MSAPDTMLPQEVWAIISRKVVDTRALACVCCQIRRTLAGSAELVNAVRAAVGYSIDHSVLTVESYNYYSRAEIATVYHLIECDNADVLAGVLDSDAIEHYTYNLCVGAPRTFELLTSRGIQLKSSWYSAKNGITYLKKFGCDEHVINHTKITRKFIDFILSDMPGQIAIITDRLLTYKPGERCNVIFHAYKKRILPPAAVESHVHRFSYMECAEFIRENPTATVNIAAMSDSYFHALSQEVNLVDMVLALTGIIPSCGVKYLIAKAPAMSKAQIALALTKEMNRGRKVNLLYYSSREDDFCVCACLCVRVCAPPPRRDHTEKLYSVWASSYHTEKLYSVWASSYHTEKNSTALTTARPCTHCNYREQLRHIQSLSLLYLCSRARQCPRADRHERK